MYTDSDTDTIMMPEATGAVVKSLLSAEGAKETGPHPEKGFGFQWENRPCALGKGRKLELEGTGVQVGSTH